MNYSKYFPLTLHVILALLAIGTAGGSHAENLRPLIEYPLTGLAATAWFRILG